jgi:hypothetical protein
MQRAQSDDVYRYAGLCTNPLILDLGGQTPPAGHPCTKATGIGFCRTAGHSGALVPDLPPGVTAGERLSL